MLPGVENFPPNESICNNQITKPALLLLQITYLGVSWQVFLFQWHFLRHKKKVEVGRRNVCKKTMKSRPREQDDARYPKAALCLGIKQIKDINKTSVTLVFRFDEHGWFTLIQHSFFLSTENSQALHRVYEAQTCLGYVHKEGKMSLSSQSHFLFLEPSTYFWPRYEG